jgi:hypothetical protein
MGSVLRKSNINRPIQELVHVRQTFPLLVPVQPWLLQRIATDQEANQTISPSDSDEHMLEQLVRFRNVFLNEGVFFRFRPPDVHSGALNRDNF